EPESHAGKAVVGLHFVCQRGRGVTANGDGTLWTGTWVVSKEHAAHGAKIGAYVALHESKSEPSYLQGKIKDSRNAKREREYAEGRPARTENGIDFLLEPTTQSYTWSGDGAGEKGYVWG